MLADPLLVLEMALLADAEADVHRLDAVHGVEERGPGLHAGADLHLRRADAAGERGRDPRVGDVQLGLLHLRARRFDVGALLRLLGQRGVELLAADGVLFDKRPVAVHVLARLAERRLPLRESGAGLLQRRLVRPGIDPEEERALLHDRAFREGDLLEETGDLRSDLDGIRGRRLPHELAVDGDVALRDRCYGDRRRACGRLLLRRMPRAGKAERRDTGDGAEDRAHSSGGLVAAPSMRALCRGGIRTKTDRKLLLDELIREGSPWRRLEK